MNIRHWNIYVIQSYFAIKNPTYIWRPIVDREFWFADKNNGREEVAMCLFCREGSEEDGRGATILFWRIRREWFESIYTGSAAATFFVYRDNRILFYAGASNHKSFESERGLSSPA